MPNLYSTTAPYEKQYRVHFEFIMQGAIASHVSFEAGSILFGGELERQGGPRSERLNWWDAKMYYYYL